MNTPPGILHPVLRDLGLMGIVPVVVIDNPRHAGPLGAALTGGGLACAEITFRTAAARDAIAEMRREHPTMLIGAGTVLSVEQAGMALDAGASFIVAPGLNPTVVSYCQERQIPVTPGIMTPTDIEAALGLGLHALKFFPAEAAGGLKFLKAVSAPYRSVRFIPTGGIDRSNFLQYLSFPPTLAIGGSWMVKAKTIREEKFDEIQAEVRESVREMLGLSIMPCLHPGASGAIEELGRVVPLGTAFPEATAQTEAEGVLRISARFVDRAAARLAAAGYGFRQGSSAPTLEKTWRGLNVELVQLAA